MKGDYIEYKIGETFNFGYRELKTGQSKNVLLKTVEAEVSCASCFLFDFRCSKYLCSKSTRTDKKNVKFIRHFQSKKE